MTQSTKNYGMFKKCQPGKNRDIKDAHVKNLMDSMAKNNWTIGDPIKVNEHMLLIDGQHRLEAAKKLGIEIYFNVEPGLTEEDIPRMNKNRLNWTITNYLERQISCGNIHYVKFYEFMNKFDSTPSETYYILTGKTNHTEFHDGKFIFPSDQEMVIVNKNMSRIKIISDNIKNLKLNSTEFLNHRTFKKALLRFLENEEINFDTFLNKLCFKINSLHSMPSIRDYINLFSDIYNWKNSKKVNIKVN